MKTFAADLHIHTALSPCSEKQMTPPAIVAAALAQGLDLIAICDHNSVANAGAAIEAGEGMLAVLPGMEIATAEQIHVLGLFPTLDGAQRAAEEVHATLVRCLLGHRFEEQPVMNALGDVVAAESSALGDPSGFELAAAVALIRENGGLAIAAHVDRRSYSVMSQLGALPDTVRFDALEISAAGVERAQDAPFRDLGLPLIASSDSHFLSTVGECRTLFQMYAPTFDELALALRGAGGRSCRIA
ncbi:MAG: PHP-associated domain-containing protein [FCB group bacterium]|nr:PHP-associated domain-containing protein [FCB group bacterium]